MSFLSIIVPHKDAGAAVVGQLAAVVTQVSRWSRDFEVLVIDAGSNEVNRELLLDAAQRYDMVRVLETRPPAGLSGALCSGIAEARGERIVVIEAGNRWSAGEIKTLVQKLARADLVYARPRCATLEKVWRRAARAPRWALLGLQVRDPDSLFFAARKEAIENLPLTRGMYRYLANLVAARGYRVAEMSVQPQGRASRPHDGWPNPGDLLAAWWLTRRGPQHHPTATREVEPEARLKIQQLDEPRHEQRKSA